MQAATRSFFKENSGAKVGYIPKIQTVMVFKFKIQIIGITKPPVWRRVEVPANFNFNQFNDVIQAVFGWEHAHLWNFEPARKSRRTRPAFRIEMQYEGKEPSWDRGREDLPPTTKLDKIFPRLKEMVYTYDYGDDWEHSIKLEKCIDEDRECAVCIDGKGATPPEDCGGVWGYESLKEAFADDTEEADNYRDWLCMDDDESWDPHLFTPEELNNINRYLTRIKVPLSKKKTVSAKGTWVSKGSSPSPRHTIQELLKDRTIPELRTLSLRLGHKIKAGVKKQIMLDSIASLMTIKPEVFIEHAFYYELKAFLDIINGDMTVEYAEQSGLAFELNRFGLIYILDNKKTDTSTLHLQADVAELLAPLIPAELKRREQDGSLLFEKLALGCANIYGYTEMFFLQDYFDTVAERVGVRNEYDWLNRALYPILAELATGRKDEKGILISPFTKFTKYYPSPESPIADVPAKRYDFDTILLYGEMPYPQFPFKEADRLREVIGKCCEEGTDPDYVLRTLWLNLQDDDNDHPKLEFFDSLDISDEETFATAVMDFVKNAPKWVLNGNSIWEYAKHLKDNKGFNCPEMDRLFGLPTFNTDAFDRIREQSHSSGVLPGAPAASVKVGRNDPCPCGSGKKYKHCCGRKK